MARRIALLAFAALMLFPATGHAMVGATYADLTDASVRADIRSAGVFAYDPTDAEIFVNFTIPHVGWSGGLGDQVWFYLDADDDGVSDYALRFDSGSPTTVTLLRTTQSALDCQKGATGATPIAQTTVATPAPQFAGDDYTQIQYMLPRTLIGNALAFRWVAYARTSGATNDAFDYVWDGASNPVNPRGGFQAASTTTGIDICDYNASGTHTAEDAAVPGATHVAGDYPVRLQNGQPYPDEDFLDANKGSWTPPGGGSGGDDDPGTGGGSGGDTTPPPATGTPVPQQQQQEQTPSGPALTDTTRVGKMPDLTGMRLDKAIDAIDAAGIPFADVDVTWTRTGRNLQRGDVAGQNPKPGTALTNGIGQFARVVLQVFEGPKGIAGRQCTTSTLSKDLKGADFTLVEDLLAKYRCKTDWNVTLSGSDDAEASKFKQGSSRSAVSVSITCPKRTEDQDLFAFVRESPNALSFGAGDWALTQSRDQRNWVYLTVVQRGGFLQDGKVMGQLVKNVRVLVDTTDVGGVDPKVSPTDANGSTTFSFIAPKAGKVDVCLVGEAADGKTVYGATQLQVIRRTTSFDTVGGRRLELVKGGGWSDTSARSAPNLVREGRVSADLFGPFVSAIQTLLGGIASPVTQLVNGSGTAQQKIQQAGRKGFNFGIGQWGFGQPIGKTSRLVSVTRASVIAAGGGNAIAAGGGNVIAAGGGNAIAAGGGNAIAAGGGNAIAAGGGNVMQRSVDVRAGRVIAAGGGNAIAAGGGNVIAAGGGNAICAGGYN